MFDFNGIIPLKRKEKLVQAYRKLLTYGYDETAINEAYHVYADRLDNTLKRYKADKSHNVMSFLVKSDSGTEDCDEQFVTFTSREHISLLLHIKEMYSEKAEQLIRNLIMDVMLNTDKSDLNLCLVDCRNAGLSFGPLIKIVASDAKKYGGMIWTKENEISKKLDELSGLIEKNVALLEGKYDSVFQYNQNNDKHIPVLLFVVFGVENFSTTQKKKLEFIEQNACRGGVSIIKVEYQNENAVTVPEDEFVIFMDETDIWLRKADFRVDFDAVGDGFTDEDINNLCEKKQVSSLAEEYLDVTKEPYQMVASDRISIPFAVNEYGEVCNFEIGGSAPAHAMISGSTGSGKSVLLHTLIESAIWNYHPDDVEIWTIDYKAVEFACYVRKRTPHITVIGQDKSEDFSYSLLNVVNKEYERRKKLYLQAGVNSFNAYRQTGNKLSRIMIVIDEFHNLTQALQEDSKYKQMLENLLSEMRAMGMSFIFCSQTVSAGLQGLTEKGINQIGCRLCMKQTTNSEITTILADSYMSTADIIQDVKNFGTGQVMYKKAESQGYTYHNLKVLYINDQLRDEILDKAQAAIPDNYEKRHEIICRDSERFDIREKEYHTINRFMNGQDAPYVDEGIVFYPGAPTSLEDELAICFERSPSNNMLLCCGEESLRFSVTAYSIMSLLMQKENTVNITFFEENGKDVKYLQDLFGHYKADNLHIFNGAKEAFDHVHELEKLKPIPSGNQIEFFFGLHKVSSAAYLLKQRDDDNEEEKIIEEPQKPQKKALFSTEGMSEKEKLMAIIAFGKEMQQESKENAVAVKKEAPKQTVKHAYDEGDVFKNVMNLLEHGPDFGYFTFVVASNAKQIKQFGLKKLECFEHRIGGEMGSEDAYAIFGSEYFVKKANEKTLVYFAGSNKNVKTIRPYLLPQEDMVQTFMERL